MRVLVLGGTSFIGRRIVERLHTRGDRVAVVHRGATEPDQWIRVQHIHVDRHELGTRSAVIREFAPEAIVDANAMSGEDVDAVTPFLPEVPVVVLSSQDVYQAITALRSGQCHDAVPLYENADLRHDRYPYRGKGYEGIPDDYEKLDVEERWLPYGAVVLRLPMVYGPHDDQMRESPILRRALTGRASIPVGEGTLLWTRAHADDVATAVLAAIDDRTADGRAVNIGEEKTFPILAWYQQILDAAAADAELVHVVDSSVPADLSLSKAHTQHLLVSVQLARELLDWHSSDPIVRVTESVRWHLANSQFPALSDNEQQRDDEALATA
jgi:nucleoside-diphosphate-sugar epimerase